MFVGCINKVINHLDITVNRIILDYVLATPIDIVFMDYVSKPAPDSFGKVLDALGTEGQECMMLDDNPVNLRVAATLGMTTVYVGSKRSECEADFTLPVVTQVDRLVPELIARGLLNHEPGESGQEEE